jgi:short-subunit dehydrogenase
MELKDKIALVTGSSKGLGLAVCKQLLDKGAKVIGWSRSETSIVDSNFEGVRLDIGNENQVKESFNKVIEKYGTVDVIVNNAGFGSYSSIEETDSEVFRKMFETNVFGIFYLTKLAVPVMKKAKSGHIVNIASIAGIMGVENMSAYNGTKFAVKGMSESLFKELRPFGIKVTCILPGSIQTEFFDEFEGFTASNNMMDASEVSECILYCLESSSSFHPVNIEVRPFKSIV